MSTAVTTKVAKPTPPAWDKIWLWIGVGIVGVGILWLTYLNFTPFFRSEEKAQQELPGPKNDFDLAGWRALPVQHLGRYKPFETACNEVMRQIVGREKLQGRSATAIVVDWMLETEPGTAARSSKWDEYPFILCGHENVRKVIFGLNDTGDLKVNEVTLDQLHGTHIEPKQLRAFLERMKTLRQQNVDRADEVLKEAGDGLSEVYSRLELYESIRGIDKPRDYAMPNGNATAQVPTDPFMFVALDKVPGSPWFSMADLRLLQRDPSLWTSLYMAERVKVALPLYIMSTRHRQVLEKFEDQVKAGTALESIDELRAQLKNERSNLIAKYLDLRRQGDKKADADAEDLLIKVVTNLPLDLRESSKPVIQLFQEEQQTKVKKADQIADALGQVLAKRDESQVQSIEQQLPRKEAYDPLDPAFRMLHLAYIETRFPDIYREVTNSQPVPADRIQKVLAALVQVRLAYRSGNPDRFDSASQALFKTIEAESTPPYPGQDGIGDRIQAVLTGAPLNPPDRDLLAMEQTFNKVVPFQKAWVLMLLSMLFFCLSLGLNSRWSYLAGWVTFVGSLGFQLYGFFVRVTISGRPPVTNMYETVIWVAFMSAVFGAVLEAIYRKKVIALAAAMVATLGLVLADQMPLALDPRINPLVPVLRSNFWLTIHVLTIVSSYAGGTLAWGLGNVALFLLVFGKNKSDTIRLLSNFTYRAMQIAVLLLAAGTFLGGWWAAYSWGRFWGWDPKETGALIALVCYVIPLHMRYIGWIRDFGLAVSAILCYAAVMSSWYGVNFIFPAGLHSYGAGSGGGGWVYWACLINVEWVLVATMIYRNKNVLADSKRSLLVSTEGSAPTSSEALPRPSSGPQPAQA
jgi:ABC-type transport system involved in cytochrome c biogenesis permease subunit